MRELVYALIRLRIRTLHPEPFLVTLYRKRGVQAATITAVIYAVLFLALSRIEIRPTRRVDLYRDISVAILPPANIETGESQPAGALDAAPPPETAPSGGEDAFTTDTSEGLEQVDAGSPEVIAPVDETAEPVREAVSGRIMLPGPKDRPKELFSKADPSNEPKDETKEPPKDETKQEPEEVPAEPVEPDQPVESEEPEPAKETSKEVASGDVKPDLASRRTTIMPAYVIDRAPRIEVLEPVKFPDGYRDQVFEKSVLLFVSLTAGGAVVDIDILDSAGYDFDEAAINSVLKSRFIPAAVGDIEVPCVAAVRFVFRSRYAEEDS